MTRATLLLPLLCAFVSVECRPVEPSASPGITTGLPALLAHFDSEYDPARRMLGENFRNPGYHSAIPSGSTVHYTRESLVYALALLQRGEAGDAKRSAAVLRKVLPLQDTDPDSPTYGVWPWLLEEPLSEMATPDLNWADFCGAPIAQMLTDHSAELPPELRDEMREALRHAARAIRNRDVGPGYTNIAILGGGVCAAAGELLEDAELLDYGRDRLRRIVAHTARHGGFNEYNSPTYTCIALLECERALHLVRDPETRLAANSLRKSAWKIIADSFHPGTQQWAGPHSRSYRDRLRKRTAGFIERRTGVEIALHPAMEKAEPPEGFAVIPPLACPPELVSNFRRDADVQPHQIRRTFIRGDSPANSTIGTTWFAEDACLGSVNRSTLWTQRHPLLAYWRTESDPAVMLRVRFLHDGKDFVSMGLRTTQEGPRVLAAFGPVPHRGDWHPSLDRPDDGRFEARDFRLRYELKGNDLRVEELGEGRFALSAGERRAVIHTRPGRFAGMPVEWKIGRERGRVFLDGICYHGPPRTFEFSRNLEVDLVTGLELLRESESPLPAPPTVHRDETHSGDRKIVWDTPAESMNLSLSPTSFLHL